MLFKCKTHADRLGGLDNILYTRPHRRPQSRLAHFGETGMFHNDSNSFLVCFRLLRTTQRVARSETKGRY